jgi:hypothetical protein
MVGTGKIVNRFIQQGINAVVEFMSRLPGNAVGITVTSFFDIVITGLTSHLNVGGWLQKSV